MDRTILHCNMNNFYASVECMLNPKLKGHPVAFCGATEERHGIEDCSQPAIKYSVDAASDKLRSILQDQYK